MNQPTQKEMKDLEVLVKGCLLASKANFFTSKFYHERNKRQREEEEEEKKEKENVDLPPTKRTKEN